MAQQFHKAFFVGPIGRDAFCPACTDDRSAAGWAPGAFSGSRYLRPPVGPFGIEPFVSHLVRHQAWQVPVDNMPRGPCPCEAGFLAGGW